MWASCARIRAEDMAVPSGEITQILAQMRAGDPEAASRLAPLVYQELRRIAQRYMRFERRDHTLQATALVHEAYFQLLDQRKDWQNRSHFFAVAAQLMRRILVDYARARSAAKRGGSLDKVELDQLPAVSEPLPEKMLALDAALSRLAEWDARQSRIVELRFFGGLSEEDIAALLGVSVRTVKREWSMARAWLYREVGP